MTWSRPAVKTTMLLRVVLLLVEETQSRQVQGGETRSIVRLASCPLAPTWVQAQPDCRRVRKEQKVSKSLFAIFVLLYNLL